MTEQLSLSLSKTFTEMPPKDILHKEEDWERSVFIPIPKKGNAKECSNYHTIALMSHTSKVMLKSSKPASIVPEP